MNLHIVYIDDQLTRLLSTESFSPVRIGVILSVTEWQLPNFHLFGRAFVTWNPVGFQPIFNFNFGD
jgi:hypothetical protein